MSIYATLWSFVLDDEDDDKHEIIIQAVPAHIGSEWGGYPEDPYASFLPPPVGQGERFRAVVIVTSDTRKHNQEYEDPVLVLTGKEYEAATFHELLLRIEQALRE